MAAIYWHKQTQDKILFPELLWSKPENKRQAGKLLIAGGNLHGFSAPAEAYQVSIKAGIGTAKVLLPESLRKILGPMIENGEYAPTTPSGSFSQKALAELLEHGNWADGVLLVGDFGRNSETAILLEKYLDKSRQACVLNKDAIDYFQDIPQKLFERENTTLILTIAQLQRLLKSLKFPEAARFGMDLMSLVELLHNLTGMHKVHIVVKHNDSILVAVGGEVSTTKLTEEMPVWRVKTASYASVWWLQNPTKPFEALTTSVYESFSNQS